jgi:hypothetical protein
MCKKHGLKTTGKKADIVKRLDEHLNEESISLEEEIIDTPKEVKSKSKPKEETISLEEEDVLEAEVLEAEIVDIIPEVSKIKKDDTYVPTLIDQFKNPKIAVVLLSLMLAGGGWYWYANSQLEPFTPDDLRYGDRMTFSIDGLGSSGEGIDVTDGFIDLVLDNFETEEEICRLKFTFSGIGSSAVTKGGLDQLELEPDNSLEGVVVAKGAYGLDWLTVEKEHNHDLDYVFIERYKPKLLNNNECNSQGAGVAGEMDLTTKTWTEISEQDVISTKAQYAMEIDGSSYQGTTVSYGIGGILGALESVTPGVAMIFYPIEIRELMGATLIETGANGKHLGWAWNVIGPDEIDGEKLWKVSLEHTEISENCLGHARISMWITEGSPWAVRQNVDVHISGKEGDRSACGTATQLLGDLILPDGTMKIKFDIVQNTLTRGSKLLDLGDSYASYPNDGGYAPSSSQLSNWASYDLHLPDNSSMREHTLEMAVSCVSQLQSQVVAANAALNDDGYIWRAIDDRTGDDTRWNLSWVSSDPNSGWVLLDVSGNESNIGQCTYVDHGSYDNTVAHNRDDIPAALNITMLEQDITDSSRYPDLVGDERFFTSTGQYHSGTRVGHLIVTPDGEYTDWINRLNSGDTGATTLDLSRSWDTMGWSNSLTLAMDATTGQLIGWNHFKSMEA